MVRDTIVAVLTPPGRSAIGAIRLSGPESKKISSEHLKLPGKNRLATHTAFRTGERTIDDVVAVLYGAPNSYTGEDVVEIFFHGNPIILSEALRALTDSGARLAQAGEFTRRAFLNGKMDLTAAESVERLIDSTSRSGVELARRVIDGNLKRAVDSVREELLRTSSEIEVRIDYPEEFDDEFRPELSFVIEKLGSMLSTYDPAKKAIDGLKVVIYGAPNVGKSSILNALLGEERAIVTPIPGTTRDTVEADVFIDGLKIRLADTAGIRETDDEVEKIGVERTRKAAENADLKVYVVDATSSAPERNIEADITVVNKIDLNDAAFGDGSLRLSAKTGYGVEALKKRIGDLAKSIYEEVNSSEAVVVAERQYELIRKCSEELKEAVKTADGGYPIDMAAVNIRKAIEDLDILTGKVYVEDLLDRIFSNFCVGK